MKRAMTAFWLTFFLVSASSADAQVVGWRTDWTGRYSDAEPPTVWSVTEHVVWSCEMPGWSNATPVLVGDRVFVCAEPTTLLCVDATKGTILWQRTNTYLDAMPEEEAAQVRKHLKTLDFDKLTRERRHWRSQVSRAEAALKKKPDDTDAATKKAEAEKKFAEVEARLEPVKSLIGPDPHGVAGFSAPTPVSDGTHVWVLFGNGVAACYDLDGGRKWITLIEKPTITYGHSASPILADGRLIAHINSLTALDAGTGARAWTTEAEACWGTSVAAKVGDDTLVITPNGQAFRASNGRKVAGMKCRMRFSQPIVDSGIVYFIENRGRAYRLPESADGRPKELWQTRPNSQRRYASPVLVEGIIYTLTEKGMFNAIDAGTGEVLYEKALGFDEKLPTFPSLAAAGGYVYASHSDGTTVVIRQGREFQEVARNTLEPFRSSPVFRGKRLYVRTMKHLFCIGQ